MEFFREFVSSLRDTKGRLSRSLYCWYTSLLALLVLTAAAPIALLVRYVSGTGLLFAYLSVLSLLSASNTMGDYIDGKTFPRF